MDMQAVLKAGGVGAGILIVLNLLGFIPCVGCITFFLSLIAFVGIGILAVQWMIMPRTTNSGAMTGAVAAIVATLISGAVGLVINAIYFSITGSAQFAQAFADLPPEQLEAMSELGLDPALLAGGMGIVGVLGVGAVCCLLWAAVAAGLGAVGGGFWAGRNPA